MSNTLFLYEEAKKKLADLIKEKNFPYDKIGLSFSGGRDSTIMLQMVKDLGIHDKIKIVFFNTSMEYEATLRFVNELRSQGLTIYETKPKKTMPQIYKEYGRPFHSKYTSDMISRLQKHNFDFKNDTYKSFEELYEKYPKCKSSLRWLTAHDMGSLKCPKWVRRQLVFLDTRIANRCCDYLKKKPVKDFNKEHGILLSIIGVRQSESQSRKAAFKTCYWTDGENHKFYPLLHFSDDNIREIVKIKNIKLSDAYEVYGCERTGCVGCPYSKDYKKELEILEKYEPKKKKICEYLYKDIYEILDKKKEKDNGSEEN